MRRLAVLVPIPALAGAASVARSLVADVPSGGDRYCVGGSTGAWTSAETLYVSTWRA